MVKTRTYDVEISVYSKYWPLHSIPKENHYFFVYFITIENKSNYSIKLIKRHWNIFDSTSEKREVKGDGVVGETPVIEPGQKFEYNSGCNLNSDMGYMKGYYTLVDMSNDYEFKVEIPRFDLVIPAKMN